MRKMKLASRFAGERRGIVGIGTLIIFIALILVAAVAAGVIIRTSGQLREQARATGREAIQQVSAGVQVVTVTGRVAGGENVDNAQIVIKLRPGSSGVNLQEAVVEYISTDVDKHLKLGENDNGYPLAFNTREELYAQWDQLDDNEFAVVKIIDVEGAKPYILSTTGAMAEIWINIKIIEDDVGGALQEDEKAWVKIIPKVGIETREVLLVPAALDGLAVTEL